jgi:hypothetical protein
MGFSNLSLNMRAIDRSKGNLDLAINYLFEHKEEEVKEMLPTKGRDVINPKKMVTK